MFEVHRHGLADAKRWHELLWTRTRHLAHCALPTGRLRHLAAHIDVVNAWAHWDLKCQRIILAAEKKTLQLQWTDIKLMELTWTSPDRVDRSNVNWSWESVSLQPSMCVESEQTMGVAHSNRYTQPCRLSIWGEPWRKILRSLLCSKLKRRKMNPQRGAVTCRSLVIMKDTRVLTDQLQASLAGKDDGWIVGLCRICGALSGA